MLPAKPLAHDQTVPANDHVVRDMHQIINLGALADDGGTKRSAVNSRVGADLHVVVDDYIADLQHLAVAALVEHVAVAVRADDRAGVDADTMTDLRPRINHDVWEQAHVLANLTVPADMVAAHEHGTRAEPHARAQHAIRPDARRGINLRRGINHRARMNAGRLLVRREKERQDPGHGHARVSHADEDFLRRRKRFRYEDGGGPALFGSGEVGFLLSESEVAGPGTVGGRKTGELDRTVAEDFAPELFSNLGSGECHRMLG